MSTIKCLKLPRWCTWDEEEVLDCFSSKSYRAIPPVICQPGWYSYRGQEWYEVSFPSGYCAFEETHPGQHAYTLSLASHKPLGMREVQLIKSWLLFRPNKELEQLLYIDEQWKLIRDIRRDGYRRTMYDQHNR